MIKLSMETQYANRLETVNMQIQGAHSFSAFQHEGLTYHIPGRGLLCGFYSIAPTIQYGVGVGELFYQIFL